MSTAQAPADARVSSGGGRCLPATPVRTEVQEILKAFQRKDELGAMPVS